MLEIIVSNVLVAAVIAVIAGAVARVPRWAPAARVLWLIVLLKLVTPPLFEVPIVPRVVASNEVSEAVVPDEEPNILPLADAMPSDGAAPPMSTETVTPRDAALSQLRSSPSIASGLEQAPVGSTVDWAWFALILSLVGSTCVGVIGVLRIMRFQRTIKRSSRPPSDVLREVRGVARRLGLRRVPAVSIVPGRVSPALWAPLGRPRLVLPDELWRTLSAEERESILAHELGHLKRLDHWVRRLELVVSAAFWWLPLVYWARARLHEAEELCCDALVVGLFPERARDYAQALVKTLDFLARDPAPMPPAASGVRRVRHLKRRLTMVLDSSTPRLFSRGKRIVAVLGAVISLGFVPTWAQDEVVDEAALRRIETTAKHVKRAMRSLSKTGYEDEARELGRIIEKLAAKHRALGGHPADFRKGRPKRDVRNRPDPRSRRVYRWERSDGTDREADYWYQLERRTDAGRLGAAKEKRWLDALRTYEVDRKRHDGAIAKEKYAELEAKRRHLVEELDRAATMRATLEERAAHLTQRYRELDPIKKRAVNAERAEIEAAIADVERQLNKIEVELGRVKALYPEATVGDRSAAERLRQRVLRRRSDSFYYNDGRATKKKHSTDETVARKLQEVEMILRKLVAQRDALTDEIHQLTDKLRSGDAASIEKRLPALERKLSDLTAKQRYYEAFIESTTKKRKNAEASRRYREQRAVEKAVRETNARDRAEAERRAALEAAERAKREADLEAARKKAATKKLHDFMPLER